MEVAGLHWLQHRIDEAAVDVGGGKYVYGFMLGPRIAPPVFDHV